MSKIIYTNEDCMVGMKELNFFKQSSHFGQIIKFALPYSNNFNPHFFHVGVLRNIESHSLPLSTVGFGILCLIPMPVISVKFYNGIFRRNKGVNYKLPPNDKLWSIFYPNFIHQLICHCLKLIRGVSALLYVHFQEASLKFRVFIATINRTILLLMKALGASKFFSANDTNQIYLIPSLILIVALPTTGNGGVFSMLGNIELFPALNAFFINTSFGWAVIAIFMIALWRTIFNRFCTRFNNFPSTANANKFTNTIFHKPLLVASSLCHYNTKTSSILLEEEAKNTITDWMGEI